MYKIFHYLLLSISLNTYSIDFYTEEINYWPSEENRQIDSETVKNERKNIEIVEEFNWQEYLNPKNDKFYTGAKEIRLEVLKNPSKENIQRLKQWESASIQRYLALAENDVRKTPTNEQLRLNYVKKNTPTDLKKIEITFFYESTCPYCKAMIKQLLPFYKKGLEIELVKIDEKMEAVDQPYPVRPLKEGESIISGLSKDGKIAVPYLIIKNKITNNTNFIRGYQNIQEIL